MTSIVSMKGIAKSYVRGRQRVEVLRGIDLDGGSRASSSR